MENLKIKVGSGLESKEAQELFFKLGCYWNIGLEVRNLDAKFLYVSNNQIKMGYCSDNFSNTNYREITLAELRDMVNQDQDEPFLTPESLNDQYAEIEQVRKHRHYFKDVSNIAEIDVYAVLKLFDVTDPCLQHIVKKALCAGKRGHKDMMEDLQNIVDTAIRAVELNS